MLQDTWSGCGNTWSEGKFWYPPEMLWWGPLLMGELGCYFERCEMGVPLSEVQPNHHELEIPVTLSPHNIPAISVLPQWTT